jgi:Skp family chaperone for outer membrane proteins
MRRAATLLSLCLCGVLLTRLATAESGAKAPPPPTAAAVVDLAKLTANLDESKQLKTELEKQRDDAQKTLQQLKDEVTSATKDLDATAKEQKGSPQYLRGLAHKIELESTYKARGETQQQLLDYAEGQNMKAMFNKVVDAVERIGKERGYDLVLWDDRTIVPPTVPATGAQVWNLIRDRRIMYASDRVDITNDVLLLMNNEYKAGKK